MSKSRPLAFWLFICCGMIFVMALLGAITRLTESGLSITDWAPITGVLPPLNRRRMGQGLSPPIRQIPQYQLLHRNMTLGEFKHIYFWEWLHRLWGRLIGVGLRRAADCFSRRGKISKTLGLKLLRPSGAGRLQGFIGWFMVESGLERAHQREPLSPRACISASRC